MQFAHALIWLYPSAVLLPYGMSLESLAGATQSATVDWAKYLVPLITVVSGAIIGGFVTYFNTNRIRKQDMLDKEKQKAYEEIGDYLFKVLRTISKYKMNGFEPLNENIEVLVHKIAQDVDDFIENQPSRRHILSFNSDSQAKYDAVLTNLDETKDWTDKIIARINQTKGLPYPEGFPGMTVKGHRSLWARLDDSISEVRESAGVCHDSLRSSRLKSR